MQGLAQTMQVGAVIAGRYRLLNMMAQGGMGAVYQAEHLVSKKRVALKLLFSNQASHEITVERFLREASVAASVGHPGIVEVYDAGSDEYGQLFIAMELLHGESLERRMKRPLPLSEALELMLGILDPIAAAHRLGYVHRDIKPENIFLTADRIKILDFGLVREPDKSKTETGITFGTPEYMAPEQAMNAKHASPASDVWALGVILYQMITGRTPFFVSHDESPSAIMVRAIRDPHTPVLQLAPQLPLPVADIVEACLQKDSTQRPPTAGEMQDRILLATTGRRHVSPGQNSNGLAFDKTQISMAPPQTARPDLHVKTSGIHASVTKEFKDETSKKTVISERPKARKTHLGVWTLGGAGLLLAGFGILLWLPKTQPLQQEPRPASETVHQKERPVASPTPSPPTLPVVLQQPPVVPGPVVEQPDVLVESSKTESTKARAKSPNRVSNPISGYRELTSQELSEISRLSGSNLINRLRGMHRGSHRGNPTVRSHLMQACMRQGLTIGECF